jgi:hypothetical protein
VLLVPYQRGDSGVLLAFSKLQRSKPILDPKIDIASSCHEQFGGRMPILPVVGRDAERRCSKYRLKIDVTSSCNERPSDGRMSILDCIVDRRVPTLVLKIHVTTRSYEQFNDGRMPTIGRDVERCVPLPCVKTDFTASCKQLFHYGHMTMFGSEE